MVVVVKIEESLRERRFQSLAVEVASFQVAFELRDGHGFDRGRGWHFVRFIFIRHDDDVTQSERERGQRERER